jgi:hypothetical protein
MPRGTKRGHRWMTIQVPSRVYDTLTKAAAEDSRSLNVYVASVLAAHADLLRITENDALTRLQLLNLSKLSADEQVRVLDHIGDLLHANEAATAVVEEAGDRVAPPWKKEPRTADEIETTIEGAFKSMETGLSPEQRKKVLDHVRSRFVQEQQGTTIDPHEKEETKEVKP